jgi:hypothetical protein
MVTLGDAASLSDTDAGLAGAVNTAGSSKQVRTPARRESRKSPRARLRRSRRRAPTDPLPRNWAARGRARSRQRESGSKSHDPIRIEAQGRIRSRGRMDSAALT